MGEDMHSVTLEIVSPSEAEKMLATMTNNRKVSEGKMIEYALAMASAQWSLNGETIKFDKDGHLFDGQHRLRACILAGQKFRTFICRGIEDPEAFSTVDVGKTRTHGDIFSLAGYSNANVASAAASLVYLYKTKQAGWAGPTTLHIDKAADGTVHKLARKAKYVRPVSKDALLDFAKPVSEELNRAVRVADNSKAKKLLSTSMVAGLYFLFAEKNLEDARRFFEDLGEGVGLGATDPVLHLREKLSEHKRKPTKMQRWYWVGLCIKAWNKRRAGEHCRALRVMDGEEFPFKLN